MDKYLEKLDHVSDELINEMVKMQKEYIAMLHDLLDNESTIQQKTIKSKIEKANRMLKNLAKDTEKLYEAKQLSFFKDMMNTVGKNEKVKINFDAVPWRQINELAKTGLVFMQNYEDDIIKFVKSQLYISLLNGESYRDALNRIKVIGNNTTRPAVMIRDQMSRIYQSAINTVYQGDPNKNDYIYMWAGPADSRTTEICKARKAKNPYTIEDVEKLDPHPHIQCRHRWIRKIKTVENTKKSDIIKNEEDKQNTIKDDNKMNIIIPKDKNEFKETVNNILLNDENAVVQVGLMRKDVLEYLGLNKEKNDIVLTGNRCQHILERRKKDFQKVIDGLKDSIDNFTYALIDNRGSLIIISEQNEKHLFKVIIFTDTSEDKKLSVNTAYFEDIKEINKILNKGVKIWKK